MCTPSKSPFFSNFVAVSAAKQQAANAQSVQDANGSSNLAAYNQAHPMTASEKMARRGATSSVGVGLQV